jgi:hypothetical protein
MRLSVRLGVATAVVVAVLGVAAPAYAINDPRVPGNECSPDNSSAVGDPVGGNPGITGNKNVSPFVSGHNPGVLGPALAPLTEIFGVPGAQGQLRSNAIGTCPNSLLP